MQPTPGRSAVIRPRLQRHRRGLSLLEILVSTAILVASVTAIMQLLNVGHNSRLSAVLNSEAVLRCRSVMGELQSGVRSLASSGDQPFEDDSQWVWSATVADQGSSSLLEVEVTVKHVISGERTNASWSLKRFIRDPEIFLDATGGDE